MYSLKMARANAARMMAERCSGENPEAIAHKRAQATAAGAAFSADEVHTATPLRKLVIVANRPKTDGEHRVFVRPLPDVRVQLSVPWICRSSELQPEVRGFDVATVR
ncbi:hypothetical protein [Paraburkholderia rhynchosiae]|uniref:Uncharacterized protein n=1 Tax=Paraburkholderia rhynchosiae TaxID=487049 RepID=A0A6J5CUZ8_9BURK|nr:hypothetical protein [Paraburkholderia rhynchosiae]CAB3744304.1 hypothetical protein LMG27174_07153 [Paraburkholderia rhynchosiae]